MDYRELRCPLPTSTEEFRKKVCQYSHIPLSRLNLLVCIVGQGADQLGHGIYDGKSPIGT